MPRKTRRRRAARRNPALDPPGPWRFVQRKDDFILEGGPRRQVVFSIYTGLIPSRENQRLIESLPELLARRNPRVNPPAAGAPGRLIYPRVLYMVCQKDPRGRDGHPCDAKCRAANHTYKHSYAGRRPQVAAYGRQNDVVLTDFRGW